MSWISPDVRILQQLFALNPYLEAQLTAFSSALWSQPYLPATTLELCRLRIARLLQCMPEFIQRHAEVVGLSVQKVLLLNHYPRNRAASWGSPKGCAETQIFSYVYQDHIDYRSIRLRFLIIATTPTSPMPACGSRIYRNLLPGSRGD